MANINPAKLLLILAGIALLLGGITWATMVRQPKGTTVLLIGKSGSDHPEAVAACVAAAVERIVKDGATVYIAPVGRSSTAFWRRVPTALRGAATTNPFEARKQRRAAHAAIARQLARLKREARPPGSSDSLAATASAGRLLALEPRPKRLVVCADAHQVGSGVNVYSDRLDAEEARDSIRRIRPLLPDLRDVDVVIGAAGLDDEAELSPERAKSIERFWTKHWARAVRARSMQYDSMPHLKKAR